MPVTIDGTNGISGVDGSASTPAVQGTDTNTGMFFPAADTIAFAEGGTESMRIDSSGNVGIGTSSPAQRLDVVGGYIRQQTQSNSVTGNHTLIFTNSSSTVDFGTYIEHINNGVVDTRIQSGGAGGSTGLIVFSTNTAGNAATERMRITAAGEVLVGGTTDNGAYNLQCNGTGVWGAGAYVNGSDERIKEEIAPIDSGLDVVEKLNPVTYRYKEDWSKDQSTQTGFIAQELLVALEGKNYVDGVVQQGGKYMSVAYQNIIPILTKAIQELKAIVDEQAEKIKALEAR